MDSYRIAVLPGDGIGPEVMAPAVAALRAAAEAGGFRLEFTPHKAGAAHYQEHEEALPSSVRDDCLAADAVFLAAIGLPDVRMPDGTEVAPLMMVGLRRAMGLHSALRPIKLYPGVPSPLGDVAKGIDFVIVRENLEGLFASFGGGAMVGDAVATDTLVITRDGTTKVCETAFRLAARRSGRPLDGKKLVTGVDKANVFRSFAFFRKVFQEVATRHPNVAAESTYVDAASLYMVQNPQAFDVIVTENQFGDILSDLGAALVGGLGLAPSAEIGEYHGLFQPSHGTAPQLAGKDVANPLATILSGAMLLDWLGEKHGDEAASAAGGRIEAAVASVLADGSLRTPDLGGTSGTRAVGQAVVEAIRSGAKS
ncbi:MAG: isocitrate/isopropylmalate dehydrogenase family protein [Pirellulales bacterium]